MQLWRVTKKMGQVLARVPITKDVNPGGIPLLEVVTGQEKSAYCS